MLFPLSINTDFLFLLRFLIRISPCRSGAQDGKGNDYSLHPYHAGAGGGTFIDETEMLFNHGGQNSEQKLVHISIESEFWILFGFSKSLSFCLFVGDYS